MNDPVPPRALHVVRPATLTPGDTAAGTRFRAPLHARVAVFFDALDVAWDYEEDGDALNEAGQVLPEFCLPGLQAWAAVTAAAPTHAARMRCAQLALQGGSPVWILHRLPDSGPARFLHYALATIPSWYMTAVFQWDARRADALPSTPRAAEAGQSWHVCPAGDVLSPVSGITVYPMTLVDRTGVTATPTLFSDGFRVVWEVRSSLSERMTIDAWSPAATLLSCAQAQVDAACATARAARVERVR